MFEFLNSIADFFTTGIYLFVVDASAYLLSTAIIWYWKIKLAGLEFAWSIAQGVLSNLNITQSLQTFWGALPSEVSAGASFFRVPEALNLILSALATRFVMSLIPFV